jgi:hypothetical protein
VLHTRFIQFALLLLLPDINKRPPTYNVWHWLARSLVEYSPRKRLKKNHLLVGFINIPSCIHSAIEKSTTEKFCRYCCTAAVWLLMRNANLTLGYTCTTLYQIAVDSTSSDDPVACRHAFAIILKYSHVVCQLADSTLRSKQCHLAQYLSNTPCCLSVCMCGCARVRA